MPTQPVSRTSPLEPSPAPVPAPAPRALTPPTAVDSRAPAALRAQVPENPRALPSAPGASPAPSLTPVELDGLVHLDGATGLPLLPPLPGYWDEVVPEAPKDAAELTSAYHRLALAIAGRPEGNQFAKLDLGLKAKLLGQLEATAAGRGLAAQAKALPADEALRLRASLSCVLHELVAALAPDTSPAARRLLRRGLELLAAQAEAEAHAGLRTHRQHELQRLHAAIPDDLRAGTAPALRARADAEAAPLRRLRLSDSDGDGRADLIDRLFDVGLTTLAKAEAHGLEPQALTPEADGIAAPHLVAIAAWLDDRLPGPKGERDTRIVAAGHFKGDHEAPPVRFVAQTAPGAAPMLAMSVNTAYAHVSPEALRAAAAFELSRHLTTADPGFVHFADPRAGRAHGVLAAAQATAESPAKEAAVWASLLRAYGLPAIPLAEARRHDEPAELLAALRREAPEAHAALGRAPADLDRPRGAVARSFLPEPLLATQTPVLHGKSVGSYYCAHVFYQSQLLAAAPRSSIVRNDEDEPLVGFLHVPGDAYSNQTRPFYVPAERFAELRQVVGAALRGYLTTAAEMSQDGPLRLVLAGFGEWTDAPSNPAGELVKHRENIDAAMQHAFAGELETPAGSARALGAGEVLTYRVRLQGVSRVVEILTQELPVTDAALDPKSPSSLAAAMQAHAPHVVLAMGYTGREYRAEWRASDEGFDAAGFRHDYDFAKTRTLPDNFSLARALRRRPSSP